MAKNAKAPNGKSIDSGRETRVLLESMHSDIKRIAEGHGVLLGKLEEHDGRFTEMDSRFDRIESVLTDTNDRVKSIEKKLDTHETRITKLEEKTLV